MNLPVFCYGTLRSGQGNHSWALSGRTLNEVPATLTRAVMHDNNGGFPFVTQSDATDENVVVGDLMFIRPDLYQDVLGDLDGLEGYYGPEHPGNMYDRVLVEVTTATGETIEAYTYLVAQDLYERRVKFLPLVASGDWVAHKRPAAV